VKSEKKRLLPSMSLYPADAVIARSLLGRRSNPAPAWERDDERDSDSYFLLQKVTVTGISKARFKMATVGAWELQENR
jgi:hypothetical protein